MFFAKLTKFARFDFFADPLDFDYDARIGYDGVILTDLRGVMVVAAAVIA